MKSKKKGNVLIITLIVLLVLMFHILIYVHLTISTSRNFQAIQTVNQERLMITSLLAHIKYTNQNDILLSDYIHIDNCIVDYTVDDMGDYFYIEMSLTYEKRDVRCNFDLDKSRNYLTRFEYND